MIESQIFNTCKELFKTQPASSTRKQATQQTSEHTAKSEFNEEAIAIQEITAFYLLRTSGFAQNSPAKFQIKEGKKIQRCEELGPSQLAKGWLT